MTAKKHGLIVREENWDHRTIVRMILDAPDKPVNVLTPDLLTAINDELTKLERRPPSALILESAKPDIFIAGADINEILKITDADHAAGMAKQGRDILWKFHAIHCPTFAAIDGVALGGGLEIAMFCDYRIVSDNPKTKLGLPEVNLGIIPGFGGTQTLPRLIGMKAALDMILTGRQIDGRRAEKMGLADRCVPRDIFAREVRRFVESHPRKSIWPRRSPPFFLLRELMCAMAKRTVLGKTYGNYPAPLAAIDAVRRGVGGTLFRGLNIETEHFAPLPGTFQCKNLIRTFFQTEKFKKFSPTASPGVAPVVLPRSCAVIGAGTMGAGIAHHLAACGFHVRLKDVEAKFVQKGLKTVESLVKGALKKKRIRREEARDILARVHPALGYEPLRGTDLAIEAVIEDLPLKQKIFKDLESVCGPEAFLASNTSSLSITKMSAGRARPDCLIGLHFFNPVDKMPLVEIVIGDETAPETIRFAVEFVKKIKKTPVLVKDRPGFLVNRLLMPYMNEAVHLLAEGVRIDVIDKIALKFGMPMGPLHLTDVVGIDVAEKVAGVLHGAFGDRMTPCPFFELMKKQKRLGQKNGKGFYVYSERTKHPDESLYSNLPNPPALDADDILDRLMLTMVNEAARVLDEGVVENAETVDVGMLLGTGFPPFRGGLLNYADERGLKEIVDRLRNLTERFGSRFSPCDHLVRSAGGSGRFHSS